MSVCSKGEHAAPTTTLLNRHKGIVPFRDEGRQVKENYSLFSPSLPCQPHKGHLTAVAETLQWPSLVSRELNPHPGRRAANKNVFWVQLDTWTKISPKHS